MTDYDKSVEDEAAEKAWFRQFSGDVNPYAGKDDEGLDRVKKEQE